MRLSLPGTYWRAKVPNGAATPLVWAEATDLLERELEGVSADPKQGLPLRLALTYYAVDQAMAGRYGDLAALPRVRTKYNGGLTKSQQSELESLHMSLIQDLITGLRQGRLSANGFGMGQRVRIPTEWWTSVCLDLKAGTVEARGICFREVLVFDAPSSTFATDASALARACTWMEKNITAYRPGQQDEAIRRCIDNAKVDEVAALHGWRKLPEKIRGRGR